MKKVFSGANAAELYVLAEALDREGIPAFVQEQPPGVVPGEVAAIWIRNANDEAAARELIEEMASSLRTPPGTSERVSHAAFAKGLLLGLVLGCGAAWIALIAWTAVEPQAEVWDTNGDGRADAWADYGPRGEMSRASSDRNFDGRPDAWQEFDESGYLTLNRYDTDFDGEADYWEKYDRGSPASYTADNDRDGQVDERGTLDGGVVKQRQWSFQNDTVIDKRAIYRDGRRAREEYDRDRDGVFEEVVHLDEFERVIRRESR